MKYSVQLALQSLSILNLIVLGKTRREIWHSIKFPHTRKFHFKRFYWEWISISPIFYFWIVFSVMLLIYHIWQERFHQPFQIDYYTIIIIVNNIDPMISSKWLNGTVRIIWYDSHRPYKGGLYRCWWRMLVRCWWAEVGELATTLRCWWRFWPFL